MTTIKTDTPLVNLQGEQLTENDTAITVGMVLSNILSGQVSNPARGYQLAKKFATEAEVELKAEDVVYVKEQVEKRTDFTALVTGQLIQILEG